MKKLIELKTINKLNFHNPEKFENKLEKLKKYCISENRKNKNGQKYFVKLYPDHNSATLYIEVDNEILKRKENG